MKTLHEPFGAYFAAANRHDIDGMLGLFATSPVVRDEGREMRGRDAIREWMKETIRKYRFTVEPTASAEATGKTTVTARVSGDFPGSPVELDYGFTLDGEKIASLEIS